MIVAAGAGSNVTIYPCHLSPIFTLNTMNMAPLVNAGDDVETRLAGGPGAVQLDGIVSDEDGGPGPAMLVWTVIGTSGNRQLSSLSFQYLVPVMVACRARPDFVIEYTSIPDLMSPSSLSSPPVSPALAAASA